MVPCVRGGDGSRAHALSPRTAPPTLSLSRRLSACLPRPAAAYFGSRHERSQAQTINAKSRAPEALGGRPVALAQGWRHRECQTSRKPNQVRCRWLVPRLLLPVATDVPPAPGSGVRRSAASLPVHSHSGYIRMIPCNFLCPDTPRRRHGPLLSPSRRVVGATRRRPSSTAQHTPQTRPAPETAGNRDLGVPQRGRGG